MVRPTPCPASPSKPRLLYFQFSYDSRLPRFLLIHKDEHVRCLERSFDVVVISKDCDYDAVCTHYQPDLTLFESGVPNPLCRRLSITNTQAHPHVPKIGLLHADAFCQGREGFISDMHEWGIETFFAIATAALDFNRELEGRLFLWPNSVDPAVYRDYGQEKDIEVLFTGNTSSLYPWRQKLLNIVPKKYSSTIKAHPGYSPSTQASRVAVGEAYARLINSAFFVPSCGTVAREIVRKHFEIPACNSCLITERTAAIEAAGYEDMVNCVFAEEHTVLDKLASLFADKSKLRQITRAGHDLVHARHTMAQRNQIHQWFELKRAASAQQAIVQRGPFEALQVVDRALVRFPQPTSRPQLELLAQGDDRFEQRDYPAARQYYQQCSRFVDYMPEPHVRIARCELQLGNAAAALSWITRPLEFSLGEYGARDPDPVEWSVYILCLLCLGRDGEAVRRAGSFSGLEHLALRRSRWLAEFLSGRPGSAVALPADILESDRPTIHRLQVPDSLQWLEQACEALTANGRTEWAGALSAVRERLAASTQPVAEAGHRPMPSSGPDDARPLDAQAQDADAAIRRHFARRARLRRAKTTIVAKTRRWLHRLESRVGYFLPFRYSSIRHAEFFRQLQDAFNDASVSSAIAITPSDEDKYVRGFLQTASSSTKAAILRSLASWNTGPEAQRKFDLALVDCSIPGNEEELSRAIATFAGSSQYLFLINCRRIEPDWFGALLGGQFEQTAAMSDGGSRDAHRAFCRVRADRCPPYPRLSVAQQS